MEMKRNATAKVLFDKGTRMLGKGELRHCRFDNVVDDCRNGVGTMLVRIDVEGMGIRPIYLTRIYHACDGEDTMDRNYREATYQEGNDWLAITETVCLHAAAVNIMLDKEVKVFKECP